MAQAAIGPGMAVFSKYAKVLESSGEPMRVRTALGLINQVLDEVLSEQEGDFDADTRWAVKWFEQFGFDEGAFGDAETLCKATGTSIDGLRQAGVLESKSGKVWLVGRDDLPEYWDPVTDDRVPVWEATQHMVKELLDHGEASSASLLARLGGVGEAARDLAYRLYAVCERKGWSKEGGAYNALVVSWPDLQRQAASAAAAEGMTGDQGTLL
jgi:putative DNA methylase